MAQQRRVLMPPPPPRRSSAPCQGHEAARAMRDAETGDMLVLEHHQGGSLVTTHDIVVRTVAETQDPATPTLADLGCHVFVTVSPPTASSRQCGSCARRPYAAGPRSTGSSRWAWGRVGIGW
jgi:hypothetical protein